MRPDDLDLDLSIDCIGTQILTFSVVMGRNNLA